jgi:hypothetical protein
MNGMNGPEWKDNSCLIGCLWVLALAAMGGLAILLYFGK